MKVLFAYRYGNVGGVCAQLAARLNSFLAEGDDVHFAFNQDHGLSPELATHPNVIFEESATRIADYCEDNRIDVVSVIDTPRILAEIARRTASRVGLTRALFLEVHTTYVDKLTYLRKVPKQVDAIIVPSKYSKHLVEEQLAAKRGRQQSIHVVRNCVDSERFAQQPSKSVSQTERPVCLWVGKLDDHKNWRGFIELALGLRASGRLVDFWLVGGETAPADAKDALMAEVFRHELTPQLRWIDRVPQTEIAHVYSAVANSGGLMVVTSRNESFGMSVAEALLCGCPVVSTDVGAVGEVFADREALKLFPFGDASTALGLIEQTLSAGVVPQHQRQRWHNELADSVSPAKTSRAFRNLADRFLVSS